MPEPKTDNPKTLALPLLWCGVLLLAAGVAYWFLSPRSYQAATRLRVVDWVKSADLSKKSDESLVFAECDLIRSNVVLDLAIQNLHLADLWGKRFHQGQSLTFEEVRARLRACITIHPLSHSSIIEIDVSGDEPEEIAKIANGLANAYRDFRRARHDEQIQVKLASLKQQWDAQNEKVREAQTQVDQLYFEIIRQRSTNETQFYDNDAYDLLLSKRAQLRTRVVDEQSQLTSLKKLDREQLKNVLSSLDTNSPLTPTMIKLNQAKSDLSTAHSDHGDNSPELRNASLTVDKLKRELDGELDAAMTIRETQLSAAQQMLGEVEHRIKGASTNAPKPTIQDEGYNQAVEHLKQLKTERENLQKSMSAEESQDAIRPTGVMVDIIETAEAPARPYMPDPRVAIGAIVIGVIVILVGGIMLVVRRRAVLRTQPFR